MQKYAQYCLDFFDVNKRIPVNTPDGYKIYYLQYLGQHEEQLVPWEIAMKVERVDEGQEKYSVQEGSQLVLTRPDKDPYLFEIPHRLRSTTGFAQPQATIP